MDWVSGIVAYILIWWLVLFTVLPFGNQAIGDHDHKRGHASSAPIKPRIWQKLVITSAISFVLWLLVALTADIWQAYFRDWARITAIG
ncbi:MAG: DUF1467 family protein [Proteobacteria bacterium]|nr:DUF1467 family protein [Pseudomonadota bacterium]